MKFLIMFFTYFALHNQAIAHCNEQINYNYFWHNDPNGIKISIQSKNNQIFSYYPISTQLGNVLVGFFITDIKYTLDNAKGYGFLTFKIDDDYHLIKDKNNNSIPQYVSISSTEKKNYNETIKIIESMISGEKKYFNYSIISRYSNSLTMIPLSEYSKVNTKNFEYQFSSDYINEYDILTKNFLYGSHKIKYYAILINSNDAKKCSYFESPEIEYNFGMKPLSLIWKDLWNK